MYPFMQKTLHLMDEGEAKLNKRFGLKDVLSISGLPPWFHLPVQPILGTHF